jgi:hypothetical protein
LREGEASKVHSRQQGKTGRGLRTLLQAPRSDPQKNFVHIMTGDESWFEYSYELRRMFGHERDEVISRVSQMIGLKKAMITMFCTGARLLKLVPQGQRRNRGYFINEMSRRIFPNSLEWISVRFHNSERVLETR